MAIRYDENGVPYDDGSFDYEALQQQVAPQEQNQQQQAEQNPQQQQQGTPQEAPQEQQQVEQQQVEEQAVQQYLQQEEEKKQAEQILIQEEEEQQAIDQQAMEEELVAPTSESILEPYKYEDPVSEAEKVSTSEFENARRTPFRGGQDGTVNTPLRDRLFGRKGRYTESESPIYVSEPSPATAVVEQQPLEQKLNPLAPTSPGEYDYTPLGTQGPPPELKGSFPGISPATADVSATPVDANTPTGLAALGDGVIKMPAGKNSIELPKIYSEGMNDTRRIEFGEQSKKFNPLWPGNYQGDNFGTDERVDRFGTPLPYKGSPLLRTPEGMAIIPNGSNFKGDGKPYFGAQTFDPVNYPLMEKSLIATRDGTAGKNIYWMQTPPGSPDNLDEYYNAMDKSGLPSQTIQTLYKQGVPIPSQASSKIPQFDPNWDGTLKVTYPDGKVVSDPLAPVNSVEAKAKAAMAAGTSPAAVAAPAAGTSPMPSTVPPAAGVNPMPSSDTVQARMKEALAAAGTPAAGTPAVKADEKPYQMTPVEQAAKIMADLKTSQRLGTPEQQAAAREAYQKGVASGIIKPLNFDAAGAIKNDPQTLVSQYYDTKNLEEKKLIASQIAESLLVPLSESDKEALKAGENVKRKFNFLPAVGLKGQQELGNVDINSIAQKHLQTLQGGAYITKPEDVGITPAQPNNQGPSGSSLIPTPDGGFRVPYIDPDGKFNQKTIPPRGELKSLAQADAAIGLITQKMTEDVNRIPLPNIKRILAGEAERTDTLNSGALDKLQNLTQAWSDSVRKDWSHSISNTKSGSSTNSVGSSTEIGSVTSFGSTNSSTQTGSQTEKNKNGSSSSGFSNSQGNSMDQRNSITNRNSRDSSNTQGASTTETVTSGGGTTKTQTESKETIDNRNAVMGMLSNLDQQKVSNMMQDYKNKIDQVTNGNKEIRSEYIKQADILLANQGKEQSNKDLIPILTQNPIPDRLAMAALEPHNSNSIVKYIDHVTQSQPAVAKGWSQFVGDFYRATDGHSNPANNATPLIDIRFPVIQSIFKGEMGIREGVKNIGPDARKMVEAFGNLIPAQDVASKAFEKDGYEEGLRKLGNNASESSSLRNFNSMKVLNAYDTLTNMMAPKNQMPDGSISQRKLLPPEEFVKQVTDYIYNNPKGNSHMGPVAFEMMKTNKPYREYLQKYSDSQGRGFPWSSQAEIDKYNRLKALSDPVNFDAYLKDGGKKLQPRW